MVVDVWLGGSSPTVKEGSDGGTKSLVNSGRGSSPTVKEGSNKGNEIVGESENGTKK